MPISAKTKADLGWPQLIEHLARRTHTTRGADAVTELALWDDAAEAEARIAEITEARELAVLDAPMPFGGIQDVAQGIARAAKYGVLDAAELIAVADTARGMTRLRKHLDLHAGDASRLAERATAIADLTSLYEPILHCFEADGTLADHASTALGPLRRKAAQLRAQLERRMQTFIEDARVGPHLQDRFYTVREDRYVIPVRVEARSQVRGIIHSTSQSGQTVFIEPDEIVELGNRVKLAECEVADEERRILVDLSGRVAREADALHAGIEATIELDVIAASATLADDLDATAPIIDRERHLSLVRGRHPLMVLSGRPCVPNDIALAPRSILIISGPNAGGKTVALKTAGLAALMVRAGLHVPADTGSRVPWFGTVDSDIGDAQSLENDLSTFSAHVLNLAGYLAHADQHTLLLIDEISVGTEPEQGAALAQAVLEALAERGVAAIITTHYERLKALGASDARFANASVGFDLEAMAPTFELHLGVPGSSGALAVARRMGLSGPVVEHAQELLGARRASLEELLAEIADERRKLGEERMELAREIEAAQLARKQAEVARDSARDHERKLKQSAYNEAVAALRRAREELDQARTDIKKQAKAGKLAEMGKLAEARKALDAIAGTLSEHAPARPAPAGRRPREDELAPGQEVLVVTLGSRGRVVEPPQRGKVAVQVGQMRMQVAVSELVLERGGGRGSGAPQRAHGASGGRSPERGSKRPSYGYEPDTSAPAPSDRPAVRSPDATLDVRGERADEAVDALERFIDKSLLGVRDVVFVIHGHGTGALRSAIRDRLASHQAVTSWRPGERAEGGDGVTVAWLDVA